MIIVGTVLLSALAAETYDITDAFGTVLIEGAINWNDNSNVDGFRPNSVDVGLYANNIEVMKQTVTGPDWKYSFDISKGIPDGNGGYKSPVGVTFTVSHPAIDKYTITDIVHPTVEFQDPSVTGGWEKTTPCSSLNITHEGAAGMSIVASKMTSDGTVVVWSVEALAPYERTMIIDSLEKNANGLGNPQNYVFLSGEGVVSEYGITVTPTNVMYSNTSNWSIFFVGIYNRGASNVSGSSITDTYVPEMITVQVEKVWQDENNRDGIRPNSVNVTLYADGSPTNKTAVLNADNNWSYTFEDLDKNSNGTPVVYTVREETVPTGYAVFYSKSDDTCTITDAVVELNEANDWKHTWDQAFDGPMYVYRNGVKIIYTVKEIGYVQDSVQGEGIPTGYTVSYVPDGDYEAKVVNTYLSDMVSVTVEKKWEDSNNVDKLRPENVSVQLYKNGTAYGSAIVLSEENQWKQQIKLVVFENGQDIVGTIEEVGIPNGYEASYDQASLTVTNKHTPVVPKIPDSPQTGDNSNIALWIALLFISGGGIICATRYGRKRRIDEN